MVTSHLSTTGVKEITRYLSENLAFCATNSSQKTAFMVRPASPAFSLLGQMSLLFSPHLLSPQHSVLAIFCKGGTGVGMHSRSLASRVNWELESCSARNCTCPRARQFPSPGPSDAVQQHCALCCACCELQLCIQAATLLGPDLPPVGRGVSLLREQLEKHLR